MSSKKIIIVGAGAAGLMAAGQAAIGGADVLILEKMKQPGRKIGISGKGRCNVTNSADIRDFITHFGSTGKFLRQPFSRFFSPELTQFIEQLGVPLVTERGGRVFPASGKALDIVRGFRTWLLDLGVSIEYSSPVETLEIDNDKITGVVCKGRTRQCDAVILTTGGKSYPSTGSTGDGYFLAESAGHTIIPVRPALVPLLTSGGIAARLDGLELRNIKVHLYINNKKQKKSTSFGEIFFRDKTVSGPVTLTLSGTAVDAIRSGHMVHLVLDLKPALDEKKLDNRLLREFESRNKEEIESVLRALLPQKLTAICLEQTNIPGNCPAGQINAKQRAAIRIWLKNFHLHIFGYRSFSEAIITAGGVSTKEINPRTMESMKTEGLYIAGELLDIQGDTGGFNLQAAFSTGWLAGQESARKMSE